MSKVYFTSIDFFTLNLLSDGRRSFGRYILTELILFKYGNVTGTICKQMTNKSQQVFKLVVEITSKCVCICVSLQELFSNKELGKVNY